MNKQLIKKSADYRKIEITEEQLCMLDTYAEFLKEYNKNVNLTAITDDAGIAAKHFEDSIALLEFADISGKSLIDVGTGAGFPGVPLKIMRPDISLTLLDSLQKRLVFLDMLLKKLGLKADSVHSRAEDAGKNRVFRESFDAAVSRAVASLPILCEYCLPLVKTGGFFYAYKSGASEDETDSAKSAIKILGGKIDGIFDFSLSNGEARKIIAIKKISQTPTKYPRKPAQISRQSI
ncbi:MAG: 16S rRNA (guanine(527)-N(7))-methyltransferase RsmG [Acutalibacteraceae bacterium]